MGTVQLYQLLKRRVLVTRQSARDIQSRLTDAVHEGDGEIILNFEGVEGITPSFLDETLSIVVESVYKDGDAGIRLTIIHPPTRLSSKFEAVGRSHGLSITQSEDGAWVISAEEQA